MAVPDFQTLMLPVLKLFAAGASNVAECLPKLQIQFDISDEDAAELISSGSMTVLANRAHWARTYLSKAGLLHSPKRNRHVITESGRKLLAQNLSLLNIKTLETFEGFTEWRTTSRSDTDANGELATDQAVDSKQTPEEAMQKAHSLLNDALADDLLSLLMEITPQRFEQLILDLLAAMGFGGGDRSNALMTKTTGDGGIDGIIHEDALGLDAVYIQAKRYAPDNKISRPDIQRFVGSLTGESATKGVFVTTSDFSREATECISRVQQRIVLINGRRLADLMIQHNVGARPRHTYIIRAVDQDYFSDPAA